MRLKDLAIFTRAPGLEWYRRVADGERPARYLLARRIPVSLEGDLLGELERARGRMRMLEAGETSLQPRSVPNLVDLCVLLTRNWLTSCNFCRWNCRVDRSQGTRHGTCQLSGDSRVSSYFHHQGEELVFRGSHGSGTVFFTSCNMRCSFCQNGDISTDKNNGTVVTPRELAMLAWQLRREGCHNVNWVGGDPTIHLHTIVEAISLLEADLPDPPARLQMKAKQDWFLNFFSDNRQFSRGNGLFQHEASVPMLWNSNFFMSAPAMDVLEVLMDVWLPDFKFGPGDCAVKLARTPWYWETVTENLLRVHRRGDGMVIRHLIMPNHLECCTRPVLEWVSQHLPGIWFNLMDQYHPDNLCDPSQPAYQPKYAALARRPSRDELRQARAWADDLGVSWREVSR